MSTHNPDCDTCTYAWCCGSCYCCGPTERRIAAERRVATSAALHPSHQWEYDYVSLVNRCSRCFTPEDSDEAAQDPCDGATS